MFNIEARLYTFDLIYLKVIFYFLTHHYYEYAYVCDLIIIQFFQDT